MMSLADVREGFICPQCHQDMSTMDMLQVHFQEVHLKQQSTTVKGLLTLAKQKISSVTNSAFQDNFLSGGNSNSSTPSAGLYAQYQSESGTQQTGYHRSHMDKFRKFRKEKLDKTSIDMTQLLLRLEQLTNDSVPKDKKERKKYEQDVVEWLDDTSVKLCPSCAKQFGISKRKHHCRLCGFVMCNNCSEFLPFLKARYLIEPISKNSVTTVSATVSDGNAMFRRSNSYTSLTSTLTMDDSIGPSSTGDDSYLRICLACRYTLQKRHQQIKFMHSEKDEIIQLYERITDVMKELRQIHPTYVSIVESLLNGETSHQIIDAQRLYRRLSSCFEVIDSTSKLIFSLSDSYSDTDDQHSIVRHQTICRNIRSFSLQLLQNYAISTLRVPSDEDVQKSRQDRLKAIEEKSELERQAKTDLYQRTHVSTPPSLSMASYSVLNRKSEIEVNGRQVAGWKPTIDRSLMETANELEPLVQQIYQVTEFLRQAKMAGKDDEVLLLESNLKELEQAMKLTKHTS
ncbi:unnamed protein product [Didymodactylos carnosus]|uniref:Rabenosyn-5 n=1 Tax=Didymodactylos carnosus TaxID=1234261 RepID=A0A814AUD4_9BILA|nr:unnamed protein product [Didymodactylos carnosus]CAF0973400.1 unnamed protein product [Didymodactylos carnosus]CAF3699267.1 unnamed protein product [Didymodactylos carnosus]CAF3744619.1 unnamed protein product [Didymodactylos carnosus]